MRWDVSCFCISAILALAGLALFLARRSAGSRGERKNLLRKTSIVPWSMLLLAAAAFAGFFPICEKEVKEVGGAVSRLIRVVLLSLYSTIQVFSANTDSGIIKEYFGQNPQDFENVCSLYMTALLVVCPIVTLGYIVSLLSHLSAHMRYRFHPFRDVFILSELNERSLTFAKNLYESSKWNRKKVLIVFANAFCSENSDLKELRERADEFGAICFKEGIISFDFSRFHRLSAKLRFIVIGEDDGANLQHAMSLREIYEERAEKYRKKHKTDYSDNAYNTWIYVFTTSAESGLLLSNGKESAVIIRRINEVSALINRTLYEEGVKLFEKADAYAKTGPKEISVMIVGLGNYGTEMLKALIWFCQMDGFTLLINAYDRDPLAGEKFAAQCPELLSKKYLHVKAEDGEAQYEINIHSGIDANTRTFADEIKKLKNVAYVFVALDSDNENIKTALNLRMLFKRNDPGNDPMIHAVMHSFARKSAIEKEGLKNHREESYNIRLIGDMETIYTDEVIFSSELEREALNAHLEYVRISLINEYRDQEDAKAPDVSNARKTDADEIAEDLKRYQDRACAAIDEFVQERKRKKLIKKKEAKDLKDKLDQMKNEKFNSKAIEKELQEVRSEIGEEKPEECKNYVKYVKKKEYIEYAIACSLAFVRRHVKKEGYKQKESALLSDKIRERLAAADEEEMVKEILNAIGLNSGAGQRKVGETEAETKTEAVRKAVHKETLNFWAWEYCYSSSMSSIIHQNVRRKWEKGECSYAEYERIKRQEHRRWNAYMRAQGYIYGKQRDDIAKTHPDLMPYDCLQENERNKDQLNL